MSLFQAPKGTFDLFEGAEESWREISLWQKVEALCRSLSHEAGFSEIRTPLFESSELFVRGAGTESDIVQKEMYSFQDKGGRDLTLRPEVTASVARAFLEHRLDRKLPLRLYYIASCFRHDRPQQGRYRQFHQWGVELIGSSHPFEDVEGIDLVCRFLKELGLHSFKVKINSLGKPEERGRYLKALVDFLTPKMASLSEDSQRRLLKNPLRILDSKSAEDQKILLEAPTLPQFFGEETLASFDRVQQGLTLLGINFEIDPLLVRGLDYYTDTVFEIVSTKEGRQNSLAGGGRYDGLLSSLGSREKVPAFGFSIGIERVIQTLLEERPDLPLPHIKKVLCIPMSAQAENETLKLASFLRSQKIPASIWLRGQKVSRALQYASDHGFTFAALIGEEELANDFVSFKNLQDGSQSKLSKELVVQAFKAS